jgi:hypothetical protein
VLIVIVVIVVIVVALLSARDGGLLYGFLEDGDNRCHLKKVKQVYS